MLRVLITALVALALAQPPGALRVSAAARAWQPGEVVVFTIAPADAAAPVRLHAFDHDILAYHTADAWQVIVGVDLDVAAGTYPVTIESGSGAGIARTTYELQILPRAFPTRKLSVDEAFVTPPKSAQPRIDREAALLASTWQSSAATRLWSAPFIRPVPQPANSAFGTRSIFNGKPRNAHGGADFLSPAGTPIHAPNAGRIVIARNLYYSGNTVIVDHGLGLFSTFAHLSRIDVHEGDVVTSGQAVGLVGATGRVTGPHLHWAVRAGNARVDPLSLLATLGQK